jgi:hypothetical protein
MASAAFAELTPVFINNNAPKTRVLNILVIILKASTVSFGLNLLKRQGST